MIKTCKCGYLMSDTIVPNHTNLHIYTEENMKKKISGEDYDITGFVFHCECCHRLHVFSSPYTNQKFYTFGLPENSTYKQCEHFSELNIFWLRNDYDEIFEGRYCPKCKKLYIHYHDKRIIYIVERINEVNGQEIYHTNEKITDRYLTDIDVSVSAKKTRCPCGWLINKDYGDNKSFITIYNDDNWKHRIKYEFGETEHFHFVYGLQCEKCGRLFIPYENNNYSIYRKADTGKNISNNNPLKLYFINRLDDGMIDFESNPEPQDVLDTIYIFDDNLQVNKKGIAVSYTPEITYKKIKPVG